MENDENKQKFNEYKIPEIGKNKTELAQVYEDIHNNIENVNEKLVKLFQEKEKKLDQLYKDKMKEAQIKLDNLKKLTQEDELKRKMQQKKENLQIEKKKFIETSKYFSDKCKEFKETLDKVILTTKELESEIQFLNEQIVYADKHNSKLKEELQQLKTEIKEIDPEIDIQKILDGQYVQKVQKLNISQLQKSQREESKVLKTVVSENKNYVSPYSKQVVMKQNKEYTQQDLDHARQELKKQKEQNEKLNELLNDTCFQETEFEKLFIQCINKVRKSKLEKQTKLPNIRQSNQSSIDVSNQNNTKDVTNDEIDFTTIGNYEFNDFDKRHILDEFLQKEEIKRYLYCLIFNPQEQ